MNILILFVVLNAVNVVIQTIKSIATVKSGKVAAAVLNAVAYGYYTILTVYTVTSPLSLGAKGLIVGILNLFCVYGVRHFTDKKDAGKLWEVKTTVKTDVGSKLIHDMNQVGFGFHVIKLQGLDRVLISVYVEQVSDKKKLKNFLDKYNAKYVATESKTL